MPRIVAVGFMVAALSVGVVAKDGHVPGHQTPASPGTAGPPPQTLEQLVRYYCAEIWTARSLDQIDTLGGIAADIAASAVAFAQSAISARDTLQSRYDALNRTMDRFQEERQFLLSTSAARARRGGLTSVVEQRLADATTKYQEGIGLEQRIRRLEGQIQDARDVTGVGAATDTRRQRDDHLSRRALDFLRSRFTAGDAGGVDASGRTGSDLQAELVFVQTSLVPAYGASISGLLGRVPGPALASMLSALESELAVLTRQLAAEGAADDAARSARMAEIDTALADLDRERRTLLDLSDDVMRAARRARAEQVNWEIATYRIADCARDQTQWLLSQGGGSSPSAPPPADGAASWAGGLTGTWGSTCTHRGAPLGTPAGRFSLTIDAAGNITGAFVEGATSSITGSVDRTGKLEGGGSYVMDGTRLSIALTGQVARSAGGGLSGRGGFQSADGAGVECRGAWEGGR